MLTARHTWDGGRYMYCAIRYTRQGPILVTAYLHVRAEGEVKREMSGVAGVDVKHSMA